MILESTSRCEHTPGPAYEGRQIRVEYPVVIVALDRKLFLIHCEIRDVSHLTCHVFYENHGPQFHGQASGQRVLGAYAGVGRKNGVLRRVFRLSVQGVTREPI